MKKITILLVCILQTLFSFAHDTDTAFGVEARRLSKHSAETRGLEMPYGSLVTYVYPGSAAEAVGIEIFDYIYEVNGQTVNDSTRFSQLINQYQPGDVVVVSYLRDGERKSSIAKLVNSNKLDKPHRNSEQDPFLGVSQNHNRIPRDIEGVSVDIVNNSTAQAMGMEDDDIIVKIDNKQLYGWSDLHAAIDDREVGDPINILYYRDGNLFEEERPIKSRAATHNDHSRAGGPNIIGTPDPQATPSIVNLESPEPADQEEVEIEGAPLPIANNIQFEKLNVFPNPSDGIFNIELDLPELGRTSIQVFDGNGRRIYENNLGNFQGVFSDRIDIASTAKGIYFLLVRQNDRTLSKRLVLQ